MGTEISACGFPTRAFYGSSWLIKIVTYNLEWSASFLGLYLPSIYQGQFAKPLAGNHFTIAIDLCAAIIKGYGLLGLFPDENIKAELKCYAFCYENTI